MTRLGCIEPHLKQHLAGQHFDEDDALIADVQNWLHSLDATFCEAGIDSLKMHSIKCFDLGGDYVEK